MEGISPTRLTSPNSPYSLRSGNVVQQKPLEAASRNEQCRLVTRISRHVGKPCPALPAGGSPPFGRKSCPALGDTVFGQGRIAGHARPPSAALIAPDVTPERRPP